MYTAYCCIVNLCIFLYFKNDLLDLFLVVCKMEMSRLLFPVTVNHE